MTPYTPEEIALAREICSQYIIDNSPGATREDTPQFEDTAHGVQIVLAAIRATTERAAKFVEAHDGHAAVRTIARSISANHHLKDRPDAG